VLSDDTLRALHAETPLVDGPAVIDGGLGFSVDLRPAKGTLAGYRAKPHTGVIDLDRIGHYDPAEFWEEVHTATGHIILDPGAFYILVSREAVHIPPHCAAEMAPFVARASDTRRRAAAARAVFWKCAAMKRPSSSNTDRSSGGWSTSGWTRSPISFMARVSRRTIKGRA
jgi:hypothetical protein